MRLIDADKLDWWYKGRPIRRVIDEAPTVDAVPVVRCRDCIFCSFNSSNGSYKCTSYNGMHRRVKEDEFCSYGERLEE